MMEILRDSSLVAARLRDVVADFNSVAAHAVGPL